MIDKEDLMDPVLTTSLTRLRSDFNTAFPRRSKTSDGWIGDTAHQSSTSGHNPDDTTGAKPESTDVDTKPEVRALDVDKDLNSSRTMEQVVQAILATPSDRDRLRYVIYRRRIWRKANSWREEYYSGASPHDEHAHFSGDADHDENSAPFTSVLGADMDLDDTLKLADGQGETGFAGRTVRHVLGDTQARLGHLFEPPGTAGQTARVPAPGSHMAKILAMPAQLTALTAQTVALTSVVTSLAESINDAGGSVDVAAILDGVGDALAEHEARVKAEIRDSDADALEGGATLVRADDDA